MEIPTVYFERRIVMVQLRLFTCVLADPSENILQRFERVIGSLLMTRVAQGSIANGERRGQPYLSSLINTNT